MLTTTGRKLILKEIIAMNPNQDQSQKQVLPREEIVKGFRRLGDGGFAKSIADLLKSSFFPPKSSPFLGQDLHLKEIVIDDLKMWDFFGGGAPAAPSACRMSCLARFLEVTIIDDPHYLYPNMFLIEDKKTLGVLLIDDMDSAHAPEFQFGAVLRIENPEAVPMGGPLGYFLMTSCRKPNCCIATVKKEHMCRYCLNENSEMKCTACKRGYCGRECQEKDWKFQNHKTLCKLPPRNVFV